MDCLQLDCSTVIFMHAWMVSRAENILAHPTDNFPPKTNVYYPFICSPNSEGFTKDCTINIAVWQVHSNITPCMHKKEVRTYQFLNRCCYAPIMIESWNGRYFDLLCSVHGITCECNLVGSDDNTSYHKNSPLLSFEYLKVFRSQA